MIDPRPYTYEYRKPRLSNPTYRSSSMYDSLYHLRFPSKNDYVPPQQVISRYQQKANIAERQVQKNQVNPQKYSIQPQKNENFMPRQQSVDLRQSYQPQNLQRNPQTTRQPIERSYSQMQRGYNAPSGIQSHLSNYGQNLMKSSKFDRFQVYEKQQKGFNIINCQPKELASSLRVFPKLTLEDKLIQRGNYGRN